MTDKQAKFIAEYLKDFNATKAAKRAGYSENTAYDSGSKNIRNPEIRRMIKAEIDDSIEDSKLSLRKEVIDGLKSIITDPDSRANERIKAYELLGKYMTMFTDKVEVSGDVEKPLMVKIADIMK